MAITEIVMPKMGESIIEATILRWHKQVGDFVKMDETILDIATDKVDSEVPSTAEGVITELLYNVNDVVPVGKVLVKIETVVDAEAPQNSTPIVVEEVVTHVQDQPIEEPVFHQPQVEEAAPAPEFIPFIPETQYTGPGNNNKFFSPLVLNIANSEGLNLSELERVSGTGADGRVSKKDVLQYIADKRAGKIFPTSNLSQPQAPTQQFAPQSFQVQAPVEAIQEKIVEEVQETIVETITELPVEEFQEEIIETIAETPVETIQENVVNIAEETSPIIDENFIIPGVVENPIHAEIAQLKRELTANYPVNVKRITNEEIEEQTKAAAAEIAQNVEPVIENVTVNIVEETISQNEVIEVIAPVVSAAPKVSSEPVFNPANYKNAEIVEMDRMRKLISKHMVESKRTSPHVTSFTEADVTNMVTWRNSVKEEFEKREGMKVTFTPMFIECIIKVMKKYPIINSSVVGDKIIIKNDINIGMATALPTGNLIVPVIKNTNDMNFISLTRSVNTMADNARKGKLSPDDVMDGTFTFTNVGSFGSLMGTPIINQPQVAIIAVGEIKKRPVVIETDKGDFIGIRHMMFLSLSYDHRIIDGSIGASFLSEVAKEMEDWDVNRQLKYVVKEWFVE